MSAKEMLLEAIRQLPDSSSLEDLMRVLTERVRRGTVADWATDELTPDEWRAFVAQGLEAELSDPREDVYTLADGVPLNEPG